MAIAALVAFHHFNLDQVPTTDEQFDAIVARAYQEKWPFTAKGIYLQMQQHPDDESLKQAFLSTPECIAMQSFIKPEHKPAPPALMHTVQDGESLWKISRIYQVKVDEIVKLNGLEKECLYPGMILKVPDHARPDETGGIYKSGAK
jgi:hypothetical protein